MATNFWCKIGQFGDIPSFIVLAFQNRLQYHNSNFRRLNGMNFSAMCRNMVRFSTVTPEFTLLKITTFAVTWQKLAYHAKYLAKTCTDLYQTYRFDRHMGGDD